jgi:2Fe-2S ferredoxin
MRRKIDACVTTKLDAVVIFSDMAENLGNRARQLRNHRSALGGLGQIIIDGGVMPKVTYIEHDGTRHRVEVPVGLSLMRGAIDNNVPGIDADCGGQCACATCHVYVEPAWFDKIGAPIIGSQEESMLSFAAAAEFNSRLACQIAMREEFDGLTVRMPQGQH